MTLSENTWSIADFKTFIQTPKSIVLTSHIAPDGDAIGSLLGTYGWLTQLGHEVVMMVPDEFPNFLKFLAHSGNILVYTQQNALCKKYIEACDLAISLDYNALSRIGDMGNILRKTACPKVLVDHHQQPEDFAKFVYWDTQASSTAQLVFDLITELGDGSLINKSMAEALYTGIMTDTGSFKFPLTTAKTHHTIATLIECGAKPSYIHSSVFDENELDRLQLLGYALSQKLVHLPEIQTIYFSLSLDELNRFNYQRGYTEGLVNYGLSIKGISMAILITEREDAVKLSFRSKGDLDMNVFARTYFNGGGHKNAAGGKSDMSLSETMAHLEFALGEFHSAIKTDAV